MHVLSLLLTSSIITSMFQMSLDIERNIVSLVIHTHARVTDEVVKSTCAKI